MSADTLYWVWAQLALGAGAQTDDILGAFGTARELYQSSDYDRRISGVLTSKLLTKLEQTPLDKARRVLESCEEKSVRVITPEDAEFPQALHTLRDEPLALYVQGDMQCLSDRLVIAVVGSRGATRYSLDVARQLSRDLAKAGAVVVSGCAQGVDSAAHTGALSVAGGKTVGVLGCGHDARYLMENAALRAQISQNGALLSEYPPGSAPNPWHFPQRNRIISGLSRGVLVVEAGESSGSLITARCAAEQGKDVFAVPGDLTSSCYTGSHRLIRDGAKPVFSARDVLEAYLWVYDDLRLEELSDRPLRLQPPTPRELSDTMEADAKRVYACFRDTPLYTDDLVRDTGFEPNRVFTALTELEICGFIKMIEGKRYVLTDNTNE